MTETVPRKSSLGFLNPFRSKSGSRSSSRAASLSDFNIEDLKLDQKNTTATTRLKKTSTPPTSVRSSKPNSKKSSLEQFRSTRQSSFPGTSVADEWERDAQTGERKDHTEMLHSLAHRESAESLIDK